MAALLGQAAQQLGGGARGDRRRRRSRLTQRPARRRIRSGYLPLVLASMVAGILLAVAGAGPAARLAGLAAFAVLAGLVGAGVLHGLGLITGSYLAAAGAIGLLAWRSAAR